jgi:DNA-binding GntR family transcriptional regulator
VSPRRREHPPGPTDAEQMADALRERILSGALSPGTPMREEALSQEFGLSRHTVRRALQRLSAERLLISEPYRGVRVTALDDQQVRAMQQLRCALESEAVRLLRARHGTDSWPAYVTTPMLGAIEDIERGTDETTDSFVIEQAHSRFHRAVVAAADSPRITEAYDSLDTELLMFLRHLRPVYSPAALAHEHLAFLQDLQSHGEIAVREHLEHSTRLLSTSRDGDGWSSAAE